MSEVVYSRARCGRVRHNSVPPAALRILELPSGSRRCCAALHAEFSERDVAESARARSYYSVSRHRSSAFTMLAVRFFWLNVGCTNVSQGVFGIFSVFRCILAGYISGCSDN